MDGDIFKALLKKAKLTQEEFAQKADASRSTVVLLTQRAVISDEWKKKICAILNVATDVWSGKELPDYGINTDLSHILTAQEREALWNIINTQKELINELKTRLKDDGSDKE